MLHIPFNVRKEVVRLLPSSIVNDISCFAFYDHHPRDEKKIDIVICTSHGELTEYYQREVVCTMRMDISSPASEIRILRSNNCELFYLLGAGDVLIIVSGSQSLTIQSVIDNIDSYELNDTACRGQAYLKVIRKDDAVPVIFDKNFRSLGDDALLLDQFSAYDNLPLVNDLMRKLIEAKYNVKSHEKAYTDLLDLRQTSAFNNYQKVNPNFADGLCKAECKLEGALKIKTLKPWVKVYNQKIVIAVEVLNIENVPIEDVHILLHRTAKSSLVYTTKLFKPDLTPPYWSEKLSQKVTHNSDSAIVAVIDLKELKHDIVSKAEFNGVVCYTYQMKEYLLPFEKVIISAQDTMGEHFNVLSNIGEENERSVMLAVLATTERIQLCLRHIKKAAEPDLNVVDLFGKYLQMEIVHNTNNIFVHKKSTYHTLYGIMVVLQQTDKSVGDSFTVSVYARSPSQILALIHCIHDAVPHKVIATTVNHKMTAKIDDLQQYNEDSVSTTLDLNFEECGATILNQTAMTLEYLDKCMIKMHVSKDQKVQSKIGSDVDIFAGGVESYVEFRNKMLEEASQGIKCLRTDSRPNATEGMVTEID